MAHPYHHARSSVKKWGGVVEDYLAIHQWFDDSKAILADFRHRALRHHAEGIFMAERLFGVTLTLSSGRVIPTRWVGEQHVREDLGRIPSFADWARAIRPEPWMGRPLKLERELLEHQSQLKDAPMRNNHQRATLARLTLDGYITQTDDDNIENAITDLIANLGHLCDVKKLDFEHLVARAIDHWQAEHENNPQHRGVAAGVAS